MLDDTLALVSLGLCKRVFLIVVLADSNPELRVLFKSLKLMPFNDSFEPQRSDDLKA